MARLRFVFEHTGPPSRCWTGGSEPTCSVRTPHYYFFMHRELLAMLTAEREGRLPGRPDERSGRPALIALDDELRALGPRFLQFVQRNYVSGDGLFYFPVRPGSQPVPTGFGTGSRRSAPPG